ncbi:hypothetical protein [uncultured Parvibaculum sp.]|uniref:hypothetical protein n=1 Tax=uncultured Parvibaculum sp. TaxID=291828 RepID=UPI0030D7D083|tara:strand:- start:134796 stop:135941 length:1146 start_codon:yes stop_codon:yes gene_type:complete
MSIIRLMICALFMSAVLAACGAQPPRQNVSGAASSGVSPSSNLAAVMASIDDAGDKAAQGDLSAARALPYNIAVLTRAINGQEVDAEGILLLRYYRAVASQLLSYLNQALGLPADRQLAAAALADYEIVLKAAGDDGRGDLRRNAMLGAAQVLLGHLDDEARAYSYFRQCAELKHGACMSVIAEAKTRGAGGFSVDLNEAVALHAEVYRTGSDFGCAGSYSAHAVARIVHFRNVRPDEDDQFAWIRKAYRLSDQVKVRSKGQDLCSGAFIQINEFMMRLENGERRAALLYQVRDESEWTGEAERLLIGYLLGEVQDQQFRSQVVAIKNPDIRCEYAFLGLWKSAIARQTSMARSYRELMQGTQRAGACGENLLFARKFLPA